MLRSIPQIRPVSDLRNKFAEISKTVHESNEPVILTKNGYADMVIQSVENYENERVRAFEQEIIAKLTKASINAKANPKRYTEEEMNEKTRKMLAEKLR